MKSDLKDIESVAKLAALLWEDNSVSDLINDFSELIAKGKVQFFLKYENNIPVGFAQCQLRYDYVEGTETTPVGYLEGIFVKKDYRNK